MPDWQNFQPFIVAGLALGGVYSLSGVGMVVLYRTTGVLNLAFGAVGAMGAFIAWSLINTLGWPAVLAYFACVGFGAAISLVYGMSVGPPLAGRDPLVKAAATIGLALILLGAMSWIWSDKARSMDHIGGLGNGVGVGGFGRNDQRAGSHHVADRPVSGQFLLSETFEILADGFEEDPEDAADSEMSYWDWEP